MNFALKMTFLVYKSSMVKAANGRSCLKAEEMLPAKLRPHQVEAGQVDDGLVVAHRPGPVSILKMFRAKRLPINYKYTLSKVFT